MKYCNVCDKRGWGILQTFISQEIFDQVVCQEGEAKQSLKKLVIFSVNCIDNNKQLCYLINNLIC